MFESWIKKKIKLEAIKYILGKCILFWGKYNEENIHIVNMLYIVL